jgi:hypothetical protein
MNNKINNTHEYKIVKKIASGGVGTVYLVTIDQKEYALKIEKLPEMNANYSLDLPEWRDIDFSIKLGNNYPEQFIKLIYYDVIDNCIHDHEYPTFYTDKNLKKFYADKKNSRYCIRKIYSLVDTTLDNVIKSLNKLQIYSLTIQLAYIIDLLELNGYYHNDIYELNIGVIKTNKKYISVYDEQIPTFGYNFVALDFGSIIYINKSPFTKNRTSSDKLQLVNILIKYKSNFMNYGARLLTIDILNNLKLFDIVQNSFFYKLVTNYSDNDEIRIYLFQILFPNEFQKLVLDSNFKSVIEINTLLDIDDIVYLLLDIDDLKKVIKHFSLKISLNTN